METARGCGGRECPLIREKQASFGVPKKRPRVGQQGGATTENNNTVDVNATQVANALVDLFALQNPQGETFCGNVLYEDDSYGIMKAGERLPLFWEKLNQDPMFHGAMANDELTESTLLGSSSSDSSNGKNKKFPTEHVYIHDMISLSRSEDFNWGLTGFDNFPVAALTLFQTVTLSAWVDLMYLFEDSHDVTFARCFFSLMILLGTFFVLNVTLAVVCDAFNDPVNQNASKAQTRQARGEASPVVSSGLVGGVAAPSASQLFAAQQSALNLRSGSKDTTQSNSTSSSSGASSDNSVLVVDTGDIVIDQSRDVGEVVDAEERDQQRMNLVVSAFSTISLGAFLGTGKLDKNGMTELTSSEKMNKFRQRKSIFNLEEGEGSASSNASSTGLQIETSTRVTDESGGKATPFGAIYASTTGATPPGNLGFAVESGAAPATGSARPSSGGLLSEEALHLGITQLQLQRRQRKMERQMRREGSSMSTFNAINYHEDTQAVHSIDDAVVAQDLRRSGSIFEGGIIARLTDCGLGGGSTSPVDDELGRKGGDKIEMATERDPIMEYTPHAGGGTAERVGFARNVEPELYAFLTSKSEADDVVTPAAGSPAEGELEDLQSGSAGEHDGTMENRAFSVNVHVYEEGEAGEGDPDDSGTEVQSSLPSKSSSSHWEELHELRALSKTKDLTKSSGAEGEQSDQKAGESGQETGTDSENNQRPRPGELNVYGRILQDPRVHDPRSHFYGMDVTRIKYNAFGRPLRWQSEELEAQHRQKLFRASAGLGNKSKFFLAQQESIYAQTSSTALDAHEKSLRRRVSRISSMTKTQIALKSRSAVDLIKDRSIKVHKHVSRKRKMSRAAQFAAARLMLTMGDNKQKNKSKVSAQGQWLRARAFKFVETTRFQNTVMFFIVLNAFILSLDKFPPHQKNVRDVFFVLNLVCYAVFLIEAFLMHLALGFQMYWLKLGTAFDGAIVVVSTLELVFKGDDAAGSSLTAFRALRILKLARSWRSFRLLLKSVLGTLTQIGNFVLLLLVVIYIFALLGQSFFATHMMFDPMYGTFLGECAPISQLKKNAEWCYQQCHMHDALQQKPAAALSQATDASGVVVRNLNKCLPRWHFDDFLWSCLTVFQLLSGDAWHEIMYDGIKARGYGYGLYFIVVLTGGVFVVLNVFLAILIGNFGEQQEREQAKRERKLFVQRRSKAVRDLDAIGKEKDREGDAFIVRCAYGVRDLMVETFCAAPPPLKDQNAEAENKSRDNPAALEDREDEDEDEHSTPQQHDRLPSHLLKKPSQPHPLDVILESPRRSASAEDLAQSPRGGSRSGSKERQQSSFFEAQHTLVDEGAGTGGDGAAASGGSNVPAGPTAMYRPSRRIKLVSDTGEAIPISSDESGVYAVREQLSKEWDDQQQGPTNHTGKNATTSSGPGANKTGAGAADTATTGATFLAGTTNLYMLSPRNSDKNLQTDPTKVSSTLPSVIAEQVRGFCGFFQSISSSCCAGCCQLIGGDKASISFREFMTLTILHPYFERVISCCIVISALFIAAQNPLENPNADWYKAMDTGNQVFTVIFTVELLWRIYCFGLFSFPNKPNKYLPPPSGGGLAVASAKDGGSTSSASVMKAAQTNTTAAENRDVFASRESSKARSVPGVSFTSFYSVEETSEKKTENGSRPSTVPRLDSITPVSTPKTTSDQPFFERLVKKMEKATRRERTKLKPGERHKIDQRVPFLKNAWNYLDLVVVVISWVDELMSQAQGEGLSGLRGLRVFRALRPLRMVQRNESLRLVVDTIFRVLPQLGNIVLVAGVVFLVFALVGVSTFKGSFFSCQTSEFLPYMYTAVDPGKSSESLFIDTTNFYQRSYYGATTSGAANPTTLQPYKRFSSDTPICVLHCPNSPNPYCHQEPVWGYQVMKCSHCARANCPSNIRYFSTDGYTEPLNSLYSPGPGVISDLRTLKNYYHLSDDESFDSCYDTCQSDLYFCRDNRDSYDCLQECISQCLCSDHCEPLSDDAANCVEQGGKWLNFYENFDTFLSGMLTLMELATLQSYGETLYKGVDARGPYLEPHRDETKGASLFFVLFLFLGAFFILNLCIGMTVDTFHRVKKEGGNRSLFLTDSQKSWRRCQDLLASHPQFFLLTNLQNSYSSQARRRIFVLVSQDWFDTTIILCICINTILLCLKIVPEPASAPGYSFALELGNLIFLVVFNVELFLKLFAMRVAYFELGWNRFDFLCVLASDIGFVLTAAFTFVNDAAVTSLVVLRVFRVARLFRLARFLKGLNQVFTAFVLSIPKLCNVGGLVTLLLFFYTIIGMHLFAKVQQFGSNVTISQHNEYANFRTFWKAFMTLFRCVTGEGWNTLMHNYAADEYFYKSIIEKQCVSYMDVANNYDYYDKEKLLTNPIECGTRYSYWFYLSFVFVVLMLALNLFIAVIFEAYDESNQDDQEFQDVADHCLKSWQQYDLKCTCYLDLDDALVYIDKMLQQLDKIDPKWKQYATEKLECDPSLWSLSFAKSLYLRIDVDRQVPVVACVLSILRFLIIHGDSGVESTDATTLADQQEKHMEVLKELEQMNDEFYAASDSSMSLAAFGKMLSPRRKRSSDAGHSGTRQGSNVSVVSSRTPSNVGGGAGQEGDSTGGQQSQQKVRKLIPLEFHVAASKIQRIRREIVVNRKMRATNRASNANLFSGIAFAVD
ncbi:unnamed protein product [Amoebophrya sp. A120]|nr:unnamed protein product [Amoebophrya sp. A120]|eukprot:GSA120T00003820001.1